MEAQQRVFFDFLKFCIGATPVVPESLGRADWRALYATARKQALTGVLFHGIRQLPKGLAPDTALLMQWTGMAQKIRQQNARLFVDSAKVARRFRQEGFRNCVLKGQGNALLYPDPYMRTPGDIDIYVDGGRRRVMGYVDTVCPGQTMRYHHVDFPVMATAIEVHFTPSYMFFPPHNRRMQRWFGRAMDLQCSNRVDLPDGYGEISVPTASFNAIYILSHLYRHVFTEGIGLRQLLDYYFVLMNTFSHTDVSFLNTNNTNDTNEGDGLSCSDTNNTNDGFSNTDCYSLQRELRWLGLWKFAGAVMWVMHEAFGLPESRMIAPMNAKEGRFLLEEVIRGGNFGKYDTSLGSKEGEGKLHRYVRMSLRNLRFVRHYPTEALSEPLFRTGFAVWKMVRG